MKSIVSYPERGVGGAALYRGNCSPKLIQDLIAQFKPDQICDYMAGSYTTRDAANAMGIESHCYDLNQGFDLIEMELPERSEFTFWHPPYWDIITYSDNMYSAKEVQEKYGIDPRKNDLSRIKKWDDFVTLQNYCTVKLFSGLKKGGRLAILMGDIKKKGKLYSQLLSIAKPGTIEQIVIKTQHNCLSDRTDYTRHNFIPICHEYLLILRKDAPLIFDYMVAETKKLDIRDLRCCSWRDIICEVLESLGKKAKLAEIYNAVEPYEKAKRNQNWEAKVRQTLQRYQDFASCERGVWYLA